MKMVDINCVRKRSSMSFFWYCYKILYYIEKLHSERPEKSLNYKRNFFSFKWCDFLRLFEDEFFLVARKSFLTE
jgi:hypothetical protein